MVDLIAILTGKGRPEVGRLIFLYRVISWILIFQIVRSLQIFVVTMCSVQN